jgi:hypothetical protein
MGRPIGMTGFILTTFASGTPELVSFLDEIIGYLNGSVTHDSEADACPARELIQAAGPPDESN